jgi:hypothetical protein
MHCLESGTRVQLATYAPLSVKADLSTFRFRWQPKSGAQAEIWPPSAISGTLTHNRPPNFRFGGLRAEERTAWNYPAGEQSAGGFVLRLVTLAWGPSLIEWLP